MSDALIKYITWASDRPSGLNWVVFRHNDSENNGVVVSGEELGEYATYVEAKQFHPDAHITHDAAEAIKYGNI